MSSQTSHPRVLATVLFISMAVQGHYACAADVALHGMQGRIPITTWKQVRDEQVILQQRDASCAAAALATLLTHYYQLNVTEDDVVTLAGKEAWLSMADLKRVAQHYGFKAVGLSLGFEELRQVKIPVIVYFKTPAGPHNAVLRGISATRVWLADPANGNLYLALADFKAKWRTRNDPGFEGSVLAVIPASGEIGAVAAGFFSTPRPHYSTLPVTSLPRLPLGMSLR